VTLALAIADEVADVLYGPKLRELRPDIVLACGDLPFDYLEYVVTIANVPLLYVPGNHDPDLTSDVSAEPGELLRPFASVHLVEPPGPRGCTNIDGDIVDAAGLSVAGLGGSVRYSDGPNQYTQEQMWRRTCGLRVRNARRRLLGRRAVDVLVTHSPPLGLGDGDDPAHRGFSALHPLLSSWGPRLLVHGHVHPYGQTRSDRTLGRTRIVNAVPYRLLEV
jgi:Icc-related predicted phosphoesterase